jgi:hypothetical protein
VPERVRLLKDAMACSPCWVLSGALVGWGDPLIPSSDLVVFLYVATEVRLARLRTRESERFGAALDPGGSMHHQHQGFLTWAAGYDTGASVGRTLQADVKWLSSLSCPVMVVMGERTTADQVRHVLSFWRTHVSEPEAG